MPLRFRKSFKIFPGVRLTKNKNSTSVTFGGEHTPHLTLNSNGTRTESVDLPGPFSWRKTSRRRSQ